MIKQYLAMQPNKNSLLMIKIMQKAKIFDVDLFQNENITAMLLEMPTPTTFSPKLINALRDVVSWMDGAQQKAQMS